MKRLIYRFAIWLEYRAIDLQCWSAPESPQFDLHEAVIGGINSEPLAFWSNITENNALMKRLKEQR